MFSHAKRKVQQTLHETLQDESDQYWSWNFVFVSNCQRHEVELSKYDGALAGCIQRENFIRKLDLMLMLFIGYIVIATNDSSTLPVYTN